MLDVRCSTFKLFTASAGWIFAQDMGYNVRLLAAQKAQAASCTFTQGSLLFRILPGICLHWQTVWSIIHKIRFISIRKMKSLRGKPRSIMFLGFNSLLSQQAAGNLTQERLTIEWQQKLVYREWNIQQRGDAIPYSGFNSQCCLRPRKVNRRSLT